MLSREMKPSKSSARDPLDNPYVADKLQKFQDVHAATEALMDRSYSENLEDEGKKPTRVRAKARNPGPRTETEKRKYYRSKRLRPKAISQPEFFTLAEVAKRLEFESEKSILRLIKAGKLAARKKVLGRKRRWLIDSVDLNRYKILSSSKRLVERVPTLEGRKSQWRASVKCYPAWGEERLEKLSQYRLTVSIADFCRFACQRFQSEEEYEEIRSEIRARLPGKPEDFAVRFEFTPKEVDQTLMRIIKSIRPPKLRGEEWTKAQIVSLRFEALEHLKKTALPSLSRAKHGWESYLGKSVKNFYIDKTRKCNRADMLLDDLSYTDALDAVAYQGWKERSDS